MTEFGNALARARVRRRLPSPEGRRLLRARAGLSQLELAAAVGVNRCSLSRWESGTRNPRATTAARYLEVLERIAAEVA